MVVQASKPVEYLEVASMPAPATMPAFRQYDDPASRSMLYDPAKPIAVSEITSEKIQGLIANMKQSMESAAGVGLAANQVGEHLQLFMISYSSDQGNRRYPVKFDDVPYQVFINPRMTAASTERVSFWHGCLSAMTADRGKVATWAWIEYEAFDEFGNPKKGRLTNFAAVIFQHEFRHLLGTCYVDHAQEFKKKDVLFKMFAEGTLMPLVACDSKVPHLLSDYRIGDTVDDYARRKAPSI